MFVDDSTRLRHMLDAAGKVTAKASGRTRDELSGDEDLAVVLVRWIQVMGEAARSISAELKSRHPEVEWAKIQGHAPPDCA